MGNKAMLDGADGFGFWYSVGSYELFNNRLPGPAANGSYVGYATPRVELWVKTLAVNETFTEGSGGPCPEYASCTDLGGGQTDCACPVNFKPVVNGQGALVGCEDVDECATGANACSVYATCANRPGGYSCFCRSGYFGDGRTCELDQCALGSHNCHSQASCSKTTGSFTCTCNAGYAGNGRVCADIDECSAGVPPCHVNATCTNTNGSFTCTCNEGFDGDGITSCSRK